MCAKLLEPRRSAARLGDSSTMTISDVLPLEDCIQPLKRINHSIKIPKDVAQIYVAALSLFCHLKKEQETLFRYEYGIFNL